uniref:7TM GPCR serpentine receptor class x (Srx) domain-containing protein n=1 Tax=Romanomermis culicivorax TaxID=13658 RepID=A0A915HZ82_ROMCU
MLNFKSMSQEEENQTRCDVDGDNIAVVCIVTTLSLLYLIPYVICIISMLKDKKVLERPFYLLALSLGAADILQLLTNGPGIAILTLLCKNGTMILWHDLLNSSIGSVLNSTWEAGLAMIFCMAINRFVGIYCKHHVVKTIFSKKNTKPHSTGFKRVAKNRLY